MAEAHIAVPVFLPGNERNWEEVRGIASVNETGEIVVKLQNPKHAMKLAEDHRKGKLIAVSFDYLPDKD